MTQVCPKCKHRYHPRGAKLTVKQEKFARHYAENANGTEAARHAGYSGDDAQLAVTASRMLRVSKVASRIEWYGQDLDEVVDQKIRELLYRDDNPAAIARAIELHCKKAGLFAPTRHKHIHAHFDAAALAAPERADELVRIVRVVVGELGEGVRTRLLEALHVESRIPLELPAVRDVEHVERADDHT